MYRVAEQEWKDFVEAFTDVLAEVDPQIPHLPPKDIIHRIYRDVGDICSLLSAIVLTPFGVEGSF